MLNDSQREVAFVRTGNTIVSASPGTGKTKTLVARAQRKLESILDGKSLALITYTNAAADEIASRLIADEYDVFIGTIHRFCLFYILRPFGWINEWEQPRVVSYDELLEFIEDNEDLDLGGSPLDQLSKIKKKLDGTLDSTVEWDNGTSLEVTAEVFYNFLNEIGAIDFNEILYRSYKLISESDFIATSIANKFYEIAIDEFQDTNIFQYEIFKKINSLGDCTFFIVGDEKQKIYRFAGAIDNAFGRASTDFEAPIDFLNITYRSTWGIVNAYKSLFENHPQLDNQSIYNQDNNPIIIQSSANGNDNLRIIKSYVTRLIDANMPISEIAILTNSWREAIAISRHLRTDYHVVGLGALPHKSMSSSTFHLLRSLSRYIQEPNIGRLRAVKRNIEQHAMENSILEEDSQIVGWLNALITELTFLDVEMNLIEGLSEMKSLFDSIFNFNHAAFEEISEGINEDEAVFWTMDKYLKTLSGIDGVMVNTIHQSKGLEFGAVILNGVNKNSIPHQRRLNMESWDRAPLTDEDREDGRTKLYVGLSRAKQVLIVMHNVHGPSMFIPIIRRSIN